MEHILIVDGSNLLFQMFYGMPARIIGSHGRPIHGTLGFVGALLKIIRLLHPTHIAVLFDGEWDNERKKMDSNYKSNREDYSLMPEDETPFSQLQDIYAALDSLGICHGETSECEADDWIAGYTARYGETHQMTIVSQDSDFFQLISNNVHILRYRGKNSIICDPAYIQEKLGIRPDQYADFKSMTGDQADNIKGAEKIGPKTAAFLLQTFNDLETILNHIPDISKPSIRSSLAENAQRLRLNQRLICLTGVHALPFSLAEMAYIHQDVTTREVLQRIHLMEPFG